MTNPISPVAVPLSQPLTLPLEPVVFPLSWMLSNASSSLQYRTIIDVARLDLPKEKLASLALGFPPALRLALAQSRDGTWNRSILSVPPAHADVHEGVGTIPAFRRLLEYGWDREAPPLLHARRLLFRLLAEDNDPEFLFELATDVQGDPDLIHNGRQILREAAASALAQAGYEGDPRLRGAAQRILDRVDTYLRSPLASKPWVRVGNKQILAPEAAPPSIHVLTMVAHMPLFRSEHYSQIEHLFAWVSQPLPRQEAQQLVGRHVVAQPQLVLGDLLPNRNVADADVPFAMVWLELMARLQFLRRNETWLGLYERFLDDRDRDYVWHPHRGLAMPQSTNPAVWPLFPLESAASGEQRWSDVNFRLGLIARLLGRTIQLV
ncbi:MAG TPA: hypothetical protein VLE53_19340 [Gemmatimonadaceae bacterium]|nr:hypothetical protein [Gemmatimonadaceae bacterium]